MTFTVTCRDIHLKYDDVFEWNWEYDRDRGLELASDWVGVVIRRAPTYVIHRLKDPLSLSPGKSRAM